MKLCILDRDPSRLDILVDMLADGCKRKEIAAVFEVDRGTITEWTKRADVQAKLTKEIEKRANRILRHVDSKIVKRLESDKDIPLETLLRIRQTYTPKSMDVNLGAKPDEAMAELLTALHADPELAERFMATTAPAEGADDDSDGSPDT